MTRNDRNYVSVRLTEEERKAYDEKLGKTYYSGKLFLLKLLEGIDLREKTPKKEREVHHQLFRIGQKCFELWTGRKAPAKQAHLYYARYRYLEKTMADISDIIYLAHLWEND